ncbi:hypothetical protein DFJ77DRAFT_106999 [Powellomyces hirtus]|nr:hypothetical protein DFJ77DRAFT_106999 [Powellomyces hirtus]
METPEMEGRQRKYCTIVRKTRKSVVSCAAHKRPVEKAVDGLVCCGDFIWKEASLHTVVCTVLGRPQVAIPCSTAKSDVPKVLAVVRSATAAYLYDGIPRCLPSELPLLAREGARGGSTFFAGCSSSVSESDLVDACLRAAQKFARCLLIAPARRHETLRQKTQSPPHSTLASSARPLPQRQFATCKHLTSHPSAVAFAKKRSAMPADTIPFPRL